MVAGSDGKTMDALTKCHQMSEHGGHASSPDLLACATGVDTGQITAEDSGNDDNQIFKIFPDASQTHITFHSARRRQVQGGNCEV